MPMRIDQLTMMPIEDLVIGARENKEALNAVAAKKFYLENQVKQEIKPEQPSKGSDKGPSGYDKDA